MLPYSKPNATYYYAVAHYDKNIYIQSTSYYFIFPRSLDAPIHAILVCAILDRLHNLIKLNPETMCTPISVIVSKLRKIIQVHNKYINE